MHTSHLRVPFQPCRRRGAGARLFLPLRSQRYDFLLRFIDGSQERYQVNYTASIEARQARQHWRYRGHASCQISIYNRAGQRFEQADTDRRVELSRHVRADAAASVGGLREYAFERESSLSDDEFEEIVQWLTESFNLAIIADKRRVEDHFRQMYEGLEAISEIG